MGFYLNSRSEARGLRSVKNDVESGDTFSDGVVFGKKISERCFLLRFLAFLFFGLSRFLLSNFSLLSGCLLGLGKRGREGGRHENRVSRSRKRGF